MQFEFIIPVTEMTQEAQRTLSGRDGWSLSENQEASSTPTPDDKGSGCLRDGKWRGVDSAMGEGHVREEGQGSSLGGGKTESWVQCVQQITQWLGSWPGGARPPTEPARLGCEHLPLVTIPAKAISKEQCAGLWQPGA